MKPWEDQTGDWQGLGATKQFPRYQAVAQIVQTFLPDGSVLDVGCGEAVLWEFLPRRLKYLGVEPSGAAVQSAGAKCGCDAIIRATAEDFDSRQQLWDCIIFNEMLYYTADPISLVRTYARLLRPGGLMIISIFQKPGPPSVRRRLQSLCDRSRPVSNVQCTKMVDRFITKNHWSVTADQFVTVPGTNDAWRIVAVRPTHPVLSAS